MQNARKKVLLFIPYFESGGAERFVVNVCEGIDRTCFDPVIVCIRSQSSIYDKALEEMGVEKVSLVDGECGGLVSRYAAGYKAFASYLKRRQNQFCAAHFNIAHGGDLAFVWLSEQAGIPIRIVHSHNSSVGSPMKHLVHVAGKKLFGGSATTRCACSDLAASWLFPSEVIESGDYRIIKNGINVGAFGFNEVSRFSVRKKFGLEGKKVFLNVGRLNYQKNQLFLLEAFKAVRAQNDDVVLAIVGSGELEYDLRDRAASLELDNDVIWLGNRDDVASLMSAADVFTLTSRYEGLPFTLVEAQAAGLPCVVSDKVSAECMLTDLVRRVPLEVGTFSEALERALRFESHDRLSYAKYIEKCGYGLDSSIRQLEEMYQEGSQ